MTGLVEFYGKPRDRMSRLLAPANTGDDLIILEDQVDWVEGDIIFIASSGMSQYQSEYRTVVEVTGTIVKLD